MRPNKAIQEKQQNRKQKKEEALKKAKEHEQRAAEKEDKAIQRLESGKGDPVYVVLYERQKEILENQRAIMAELGVDY